jgi:four helix bundle protein
MNCGVQIADLKGTTAVDSSELRDRTKHFALRVIRMAQALPKTTEARAISGQIVRSGTAVGANYRTACRARSKKEFAARMGIVLEEADETAYWLELIAESNMLTPKQVQPLLDEANELVSIFVRTCKTSRGD